MLLALELSGPSNTLAVHDGKRMLASDFSDQRGRGLLQAVQGLLRETGADRADLRGVIVGTGPGSYTGLRIACSAGIMLGYALDIPCAGICSFAAKAFARNLQHEDLHLLLDAYRKQVYHACYRRRGEALEVREAPQVLSLQQALQKVGKGIFLGEARLATAAAQLDGDCQASAKDLIGYALALGVQVDGSGMDALGTVEPLYLRPAAFRK